MSHIILLALGAMVLFGLVDFFLKKGIDLGINGNALIFYSMLMASLPFGFLCLVQKVPLNFGGSLLSYWLAISVLMFIGTVTLLEALKKGEASIVAPLVRLGFVITAICAFIFLGEKLTVTRILGILCAIIAIFLLSRKEKKV